MKVVFIVNKMDIGGPQKIVAFLANRMVKDGHDVTVVTYSDKKPNLFLEQSVKFVNLHYEAGEQNKKNPFAKRLLQVPLLLRIRKTVKSQKPDVLCVFTLSVLRMVEAALRGCRFTLVSSERGNPYMYGARFLKTAGKVYAKCEKVVFQTKEASELFGISGSAVIPNPALERDCGAEKQNTGIPNLLLAAGRLEPEKGFDFLVDCVSEVAKEVECHLRIYGTGSMEDQLKKTIKEKGLTDVVELCGECSHVFAINHDACAYILSSYTEGMPNTLIEAMIEGIPCIATDCTSGGPRFLLGGGKRGILVRTGEKEQMVQAIRRVLLDRETAGKLAGEAVQIREELTPDKIYRKWMDVMQEAAVRAKK